MLGRLLLVLLLAGSAAHVRAAGLEVVPVLVEMGAKAPRASLVVRNLSTEPVRLEVSASSWQQSPDGKMTLGSAPNLVVFPPILELGPGAERKVRISATGGFGSLEGAYRVIVNELPSEARPGQKNVIRFLTKLSIPVFLSPQRAIARLELAEAAVRDGRLGFQIRNTGNVRLYPTKLKVEGLDGSGASLFSGDLDTWYVLAGGHRVLDFAVPKADCAKVRKLTIELPAGKIPVRTGVETPGGACGP